MLEITNAKLHVPIVTLSATDNPNLKKQLSNGFKRSFHWNDYQAILAKVKNNRNNKVLKGYLLFLNYDETVLNDNKKYFLPRAEIKNYNVLIDGRYFYYQPIRD